MSLERKKQSRLKGPGECAKWRRQSANCTKASSKCHRGLLYPHIAQVFPPKQRALFYTWIHFIQQLAVFFKHIFTARSTTGLLCALPLTDSGCSHASRQSAPILFLCCDWECFNLETFSILGYIWSCEWCRRIKSGKDWRKQSSHDIWGFWRVLRAPWRERREWEGRGHKIQLLQCGVFNTFYVFVLWNMDGLVCCWFLGELS